MHRDFRGDREYPINGLRVCVDDLKQDIRGRIYSRMSEEELAFGNCMELLLVADELFDHRNFPQAFNEKRCFRKRIPVEEDQGPLLRRDTEFIRKQEGKYGYFDIVVDTRMHSGWQGTLFRPGESRGREFIGERELLRNLYQIANARQ